MCQQHSFQIKHILDLRYMRFSMPFTSADSGKQPILFIGKPMHAVEKPYMKKKKKKKRKKKEKKKLTNITCN